MVWFRSDLRLTDNEALLAAAESGRPLIACYVLDEHGDEDDWQLGRASRWWLHHSLASLSAALERLGGRLILRRGPAEQALPRLVTETSATAVHCSTNAEPQAAELEEALHASLSDSGAELVRYSGQLLYPPDAIRTQAGKPFQVFTPFWKALLQLPDPGPPQAAPDHVDFYQGELTSEPLNDFRLLPSAPDWAAEFGAVWAPGETGAFDRLEEFLDGSLNRYKKERDLPDADSTSQLSAHLRFGEISPRQIWHAVRTRMANGSSNDTAAEAFLRQLGWREFSYYLLHHWPTFSTEPFRAEFAAFRWREDAAALKRWQQGNTGYPIVDAGMRQLWRTGWMHNRVRMVVASFLVKHLLIPWQDGARWFWDTLVDADLANNSASWQWVAGCGADAAPYFRIFNPILQGKKFDSRGAYVRRWVPELSNLPAKYVHEPWAAPAEILDTAGIQLGRDYPEPLVDHQAARERALDAYKQLRSKR
jgi:deoxyribodipyrimidine photo-lyase